MGDRQEKKNKEEALMKLTHNNKIIVEYNDYGIPIEERAIELRSYIGVVVREMF